MSIINWELHRKLMEQPKKIKICTGVGLNQFFPEYITIEIPQDNIIASDYIYDKKDFTKDKEQNNK
jgi:hypothetical protein